jgi:RNA polymerase sigma-70 factor (ECF subfamily)
MDSTSASHTSITLLGRLGQQPADPVAWEAFVARYGPKIYGWCRHWGLQKADAEDVTQDVLLTLARKMGTFSYDPNRSFRAWLKTVAHHAWSDFLQRRQRPGQGSGDSQVATLLAGLPARDDLVTRLDAEFDQEVLEAAVARVRLRVKPTTWEAYRLTAIEGLSGAAVAEQLGMKVSTVFNAKKNVHEMLQEEVRGLQRSPRLSEPRRTNEGHS